MIPATCMLIAVLAQLEFVPDESPQIIFAGKPQHVRVALRNSGETLIELDASYRVYQLTASTAVPVGDAQPWKKLRVLPGQTILESVPVTLPGVRAAAQFRIGYAGVGSSTVIALPADSLKRLGSDEPVGVFDPDNRLKPALKAAGVEIADFETEPRDCKLTLAWPSGRTLPESILSRVKKGMAVVWIKSNRTPVGYTVRLDAGAVVVTPAATVAGLADSAAAQANLLRAAEIALTSDVFQLPIDNQPE